MAPKVAVTKAQNTPTPRMMVLMVDMAESDVVIRMHRHS